MNTKIIRFGILGCGMIAGYHVKALAELPQATLLGVADALPENAQDFAEKHGIIAYANFEEMLADPKIDAVCICTPSGYHALNAIQALKAKKHVVLEKPMALTTQDTRRITKVAAENGRLVTVISQKRFEQDVIQVKELINQNAFGKLLFCNLSMPYWRNPDYYSSSSWKGTIAMDGGALFNQGIHGIDLLLHLAGDARVLCSKAYTAYHSIEAPDTAVALLEFANGAMGTLTGSSATYPGHNRRLEILGTEGCAVFNEGSLEKLVVRGETVIACTEQAVAGSASDPASIGHGGHKAQLQNFILAILGQEKLLIDAYEGSRAVALIEEIQK